MGLFKRAMKILGAIIAGGRSSRMGGEEKAFMDLGGIRLIERVKSRIQFQVDQVIINANGDSARFAALGLTVVPDRITTLNTPLAGLHAALAFGRNSGFDAVLTVPSDSPFLPLDLVDRLEHEGRPIGAAVATSGGQIHYLTGLWSTALAPVLESSIREDGMMRVKDWVMKCATPEVEWPVLHHDPFLNINTPADLMAAKALLDD